MKKVICFFIIVLLLLPKVIVFSGNGSLDIQMIFQNPSYLLEKDIQKDHYICDSMQSECRVNYNLEINEGNGYKTIGTKYMCYWDFGFGEVTGEEQKCNPNTIIYPNGVFHTSFRVGLKTDESIFYSKNFIIQNGLLELENNQNEEDTIDESELGEENENQLEQDEPEILPEDESDENSQTEDNFQTETPENEEHNIQEVHQNEQIEENNESIPSHDVINNLPEEEVLEIQESNDENIEIKEIIIPQNPIFLYPTKLLFQSPTNLLEKDNETTKNFTCDTTLTECRVNFNLNIDEGTGYKTIGIKYICYWDFGFGEITGEEQKCNPNTIIYPIGEFQTTYTIQEKSNTGNIITQSLFIKNSGFVEPIITKTVYIGGGSSSSNSYSPIQIDIPKIEIQSGLNESNYCKSENCSINLNYIQKNNNELCLWSFPGGTYEGNTHEKCNPGYVKYPLGEFQVTLKVYDKNYPENYKESYLTFFNKKIENVKENSQTNSMNKESIVMQDEEESQIQIQNYTLKITQILPNPVGADNLEFIEIENIGEEKIDLFGCNLDDILSGGSKAYKISQTLILAPKQTHKFYKYDTKININNSGKEEANLLCNGEIIDSISWDFSSPEGFIIQPEQNPTEIFSVKKIKNTSNYEVEYHSGEKKIISFDGENTLLQDILTQNISRDEKKEKLFEVLEKSFSQKISKQKKGVKISGTTFPNTHLIITLEKQENEISFIPFVFPQAFANINYETKSDKNGKYEVVIKEPNIGEFEIKTFLSLGKNNSYEFLKTSHLEIDNDYINYITPTKKGIIEESYILPKAIISLQGKLTQNKIFSGNKITCINTDTCAVNLDGSASEGKKLTYLWDFGNGKTFDKKNPASYTFGIGTYFISLQVNDGINSDASYFIVEVQGKTPKTSSSAKEIQNKIEKNNKINIIPTAYADNKKDENIKYHILLSLGVFVIFFIGGLILLRRQKII